MLPPLAVAQGDAYWSNSRYSFEQITPVSLAEPPRPATRFGPGPEGWIKIRFTINADGTTSNVEVLDAMPLEYSVAGAVSTVERWTFEPAIMQDTAVDWHNNIVTVSFDLPEIPNISGPGYTTPYSEVQGLISEDRLDRAARVANDNLRKATYSLHDIGLGNVQLATVEMRREDMHLAHKAIVRATLPEVSQLTEEEMNVALQYRFTIELALNRYMDALDTWERRAALVDIPNDDLMRRQAQQLQDALDQGFTLDAKGKIPDGEAGWFFIPSRRTFTIADVDGSVEAIRAICNRRIVSLEFQPDVEWSLPDSWGECSLSVMGDRNTTFTFYEFTLQ